MIHHHLGKDADEKEVQFTLEVTTTDAEPSRAELATYGAENHDPLKHLNGLAEWSGVVGWPPSDARGRFGGAVCFRQQPARPYAGLIRQREWWRVGIHHPVANRNTESVPTAACRAVALEVITVERVL